MSGATKVKGRGKKWDLGKKDEARHKNAWRGQVVC